LPATPILVLLGSILLLLVLIARLRLNAFLALLSVSFVAGVANGLKPVAALNAILKGIGETMGSLALILVFGAILGKMIEESGAAVTISRVLTRLLGLKRIQLSVLSTGFLVGLPMIYNASFLVLIPLVYSLTVTTGLPLLYLGIPLSAALSVTHGYLPPHPAPTAIAVLFHADVNVTLLYGLMLAVPAAFLAGPVLAVFFRKHLNRPPAELFQSQAIDELALPGLAVSLLTTLAPVLLMLSGALVTLLAARDGWWAEAARFAGEPNVALGVAAGVALYTLGLRRGRSMDDVMKSAGKAVSGIAMILLIIASGGAFKQVLLDGGTGASIQQLTAHATLPPLILAWCTAAVLRLALGSATVAAITAGGILLPVLPGCGASPELMVIATTSGSLMFSHFNDIGFWMFKEYYNATVKQTFQIWTVMESIVAIVGLLGVLVLNVWVRPPAKRVFYVNSYHAGYRSSDEAQAALTQRLKQAGVELRVFHLDAKRHGEAATLAMRAQAAAAELDAFHPNLVIVSDDDAVKQFVVPHVLSRKVPVVFCGVNWSAEQYHLPRAQVTGMLEVVPIEAVLREVREHWPSARRLVTLSEDSTSERSNRLLLEPRYRAWGWQSVGVAVKDFDSWKAEFERAQREADVVYLPTNGAIQGWDAAVAREWVRAKARKPVVTCDDFMMPYAAYGLTKVAAEQGEWAAEAALRILSGESPVSIPQVENTRRRCFYNRSLADALGWRPSGECTPVE